jgi:hypothetical protein
MATVNRQSNLFAAEDWKVVYKAFTQVNFQAYDFDTIRSALVEYVRTNFPENFNDYIESSEFIAIIEMLAYLSQSLAFRMDLNSRENFLETAERRDSVFKLARMLGYNPKRNIPASGLLKVVAVRTNEPLLDSLGNDINNVNIFWDDANNPDSYEQFIIILNAAMSSINRYAAPVKSGVVNGINTDLYQISSPINAPVTYSFKLNVNGVGSTFEVVNPDFTDGGVFAERHPDPLNNFNLIYRNDGLGISSINTGFFLLFKQGAMEIRDFDYTTAVENRIEDIVIRNINETDVFLQEITTDGTVLNKWERIPNTVGQTLNYNSIALGSRNLYAVENLNNDGIRIRYPDGNFGNVPSGLFRLYFRTSLGERFTLQPEDARNIRISIPYQNSKGANYTLSLVLSLQESVSNSLPAESLTAIKERAPQVYYTQNRMVNSQDYNVFPLSQNSSIVKLKAINRTHAGHSRYIDINDPTGTFQDIDTFATDGAIYTEIVPGTASITINENNTALESLTGEFPLILKDVNLNNFVYDEFRKKWLEIDRFKFDLTFKSVTWKTLPAVSGENSTGYFEETVTNPTGAPLNNTNSLFKMFVENNLIKFSDPVDPVRTKWVRVVSVRNNGLLSSGLSTSIGPFALSAPVQNNWVATEYIATMRKVFTSSELAQIRNEIENKRTFGLGYDPDAETWYVIANEDLNKTATWGAANSGASNDSSWLLLCTYTAIDANNYKFIITLRGQRYVVQSQNDLKFYNINNVKVVDQTNTASRDLVTFTTLNFKPSSTEIFTWEDTLAGVINGNDGIGDRWVSNETFEKYAPFNYDTGIPLRTRDTKWFDVGVDFVTNMGIYRNGNSTSNTFVNSAVISLNPYFADGTEGSGGSPNITIANNSGRITHWPANIFFSFSNTTFGYDVINTTTGNVVYKDYNTVTGNFEIYQANSSGVTHSFGTDGTTYNAASLGRLILTAANTTSQSGNLVITGMDDNNYTYVIDGTGLPSRDQVVVTYKTDKRKLDQDVSWMVVSPVKYNDGYTDNRKVIVTALDTDGDLVPDRPLQFNEIVGDGDLVFFEYYTDYDGYRYDRPLAGNIADFRNDDSLIIDFTGNGTITSGSLNTSIDLSTLDALIIKNNSFINGSGINVLNNSYGKAVGLVVYDYSDKQIYQMVNSSTNINIVSAVPTIDYFVHNGRAAGQRTSAINNDELIFRWKHVAPKDVRIDPSISNVIEMIVLTQQYYDQILTYKNVPGAAYPVPPTSAQLANEFANLDEYKNASDSIVYRSADFKLLFGIDAEPEVQAKFRIVKLAGSVLGDNEIKSRVISAINRYFEIPNWEFGETFYFTELSSYIHQQLGSVIGSIVIIPRNSGGSFGDLFQVKAEPNQLFLSTSRVSDIEIIEKISSQTLRADR